MKKITTLLLTLLTGFSAFAQFPETFSAGTLPTGWTTFIGANGLGATNNWIINSTSYYAYVAPEALSSASDTSEDWLVTPQFTVDATDYMLSFSLANYETADKGSTLSVKVSTNSQTTISDYTNVITYTETQASAAAFATELLDLSAYAGQSVYIAFVVEQNDGDYWYVDNVNMIANATSAPLAATTPTPVDGATAVPLEYSTAGASYSQVSISWTPATTGDAPLYYEFNLGTSPTNLTSLNTTVSSPTINVYGFSDYTTYYWEVIPVNAVGPATGTSVWSFTTGTAAMSVETVKEHVFTAYPNPVSSVMHIKGAEALVKAEVYNQLGQTVLVLENEMLNQNTLDLSSLRKGIYIVKVFGEQTTESITITKE
ncbi:T9SS-dependent choice-of-anchor J family protein [Neptunitalea lumnitzerae]|uniref:Secretion system C-terminal sorting domain-containing protein n=1 Tax=Neptunitalea lumnitzerae TaxID=2965509 RepID=A0ABQ5MIA4_9FLAO|nr:choice-of-anchor J domain-containing protein [Neptunitalea sp. Y10]GLB49072.1 hypothetical protein Y10_14400 [Neptunitalea sp. Y10]